MTVEGELIGIFMQEYVPPGLSARKTIDLLHQQGAFVTVPHPFDTFRKGGWQLDDLVSITPYIDAIEVFNARCMFRSFNTQAQKFKQLNNLLATIGSDSHSLLELGTAKMILPEFTDPTGLKGALEHSQTKARLSPPWVHLYSRYAAWYKNKRRIP